MKEMVMRANDEIIAEIKKITSEGTDWLGARRSELISYLPAKEAKAFLKDDADLSRWKQFSRRKEDIVGELREYMEFAWDKANNRRGLSAGRSIDHMSAWLWMLGYDKASSQILDYDMYGKPWLRAICEHFGWDWRQWDDGRWTNNELSDGWAPPEYVTPLDVARHESPGNA